MVTEIVVVMGKGIIKYTEMVNLLNLVVVLLETLIVQHYVKEIIDNFVLHVS